VRVQGTLVLLVGMVVGLVAGSAGMAAPRDARAPDVATLAVPRLPDTTGQTQAAAAQQREREATLVGLTAETVAHLARASTAEAQEALLLEQARTRPHVAQQPAQAGPPTCDGRRATIVGTNGPDVINGTPGRDVIVGLGGDDTIYGLGENDIICAGEGNDLVYGGAGNDAIFGDTGNDLLDGGHGDDTIDGGGDQFDGAAFFDETGPVTASLVTGTATGDGNDTFTGVDQLHGGQFSDAFTGDAADNGLFGNGGNDRLVGGASNDYLSGGQGDDTISGGGQQFDAVTFWDATGPVTASLATGTSTGGGEGSDTFTGVSTLDGGPYGDTLIGDDGDNSLFGMGGNDTLTGGPGTDFVDGGAGDDTMDGGGQQFDAIAFFDATGGPVTASLATGTATGDGTDTFTGVSQLHGGPYDDTLIGDAADNNLFGNGGNDSLSGGDGNDFLSGGDGNDSLSGGDGNDFLDGGAGDDTMDGGGQQFDAIAFFDETGPVTASLATGTATGEGNDTFTGARGLHGSDFADTFFGDAADNNLFGNGGNDSLSGGDGNDSLNGGNGNDSLYGEAGNDYLDGADGIDFLDGGPDFDFCVNGESVINCEA
jgi:Ca2+-binding RTX toxin-like protein